MNRRSFLQTLGLAVAAPVLELPCKKCGWGNPTNASYCGGCGACTRCERANGEAGIIDMNAASQLRIRNGDQLIETRAFLASFAVDTSRPMIDVSDLGNPDCRVPGLQKAELNLRFVSTGPVTTEKL